MNRRALSSTFVAGALLVAGCGGGGSGKQTSTTAGISKASQGGLQQVGSTVAGAIGGLVVVAPESPKDIHASQVLLAGSGAQIGTVTQVDGVGQHESRLRIALTKEVTLHLNAKALVCDNAVRIDPGSTSTPVAGPDLVISIVRTLIHSGNC